MKAGTIATVVVVACLVAATPMALILAGGAVIASTLTGAGSAIPVGAPGPIVGVPAVGHMEVVPTALLPWVPAGGYPDDFPWGQCTYWAALNHRVTWSGNADDWLINAADAGATESNMPAVGEIVVYQPGGAYDAVGHVAIVIAVGPGNYTVSEMNVAGLGVVDERTIAWPDVNVAGFGEAG